MLASLVEVASVLDDLGAERPDRVHLGGVRLLGDADDDPDPEQPARERDRLAVVPGRGAR